jgi:hypothetical protein
MCYHVSQSFLFPRFHPVRPLTLVFLCSQIFTLSDRDATFAAEVDRAIRYCIFVFKQFGTRLLDATRDSDPEAVKVR